MCVCVCVSFLRIFNSIQSVCYSTHEFHFWTMNLKVELRAAEKKTGSSSIHIVLFLTAPACFARAFFPPSFREISRICKRNRSQYMNLIDRFHFCCLQKMKMFDVNFYTDVFFFGVNSIHIQLSIVVFVVTKKKQIAKKYDEMHVAYSICVAHQRVSVFCWKIKRKE